MEFGLLALTASTFRYFIMGLSPRGRADRRLSEAHDRACSGDDLDAYMDWNVRRSTSCLFVISRALSAEK